MALQDDLPVVVVFVPLVFECCVRCHVTASIEHLECALLLSAFVSK